MRIFLKNSAPSVFDPQDPLILCKISEKMNDLFMNKTDNLVTVILTY